MKNKILFIFILICLFSICVKVSANEICSPTGYSVVTVNGIFTDEKGAKYNKNQLSYKLAATYNNEPINIDYLYNQTHLLGVGDLIDAVNQGLFDQKSDYDLVEMINDASQKVKTQKLLLVSHSQGNFYANNFYDKVADQQGGVPSKSIGVYSVASPANRVAGGGKYLTSDTDKVIASVVGRFIKILPPNIHIPLQEADGNGHSFSDVYLKYQSDRIISDIKSSLNNLKENDEQEADQPCISAPELTINHKIQGVLLNSADFVINNTKSATVYAANTLYNTTLAVGNVVKGLLATAVESLPNTKSVTTLPVVVPENKNTNVANQNIPKETTKVVDKNIIKETKNTETTKVVKVADVSPVLDKKDVLSNVIKPVVSNVVSFGGGGGGGSVVVVQPEEKPVIKDEKKDDPVVPPPVEPVPDVTSPVITILGNNPEVAITNSVYVDAGATALDAVDGVREVESTGTVDTSRRGSYIIIYKASDKSGNIATATRTVNVATYKYVPKYKFGLDNGDGNYWQNWAFNGSNVYDWADSYVDNYLHEQFKIQTYAGGFWCSQCLQRGVFKHNPQEGFERSDLLTSGLENNPQNNEIDMIYNVVIQWDSAGYTYKITNGDNVYATGRTDVANLNKDMWVGWDGSFNDFKNFPAGNWTGSSGWYPFGLTGGGSMILQPFPIYKEPTSASPSLSLINKGVYAGVGVTPTYGRTNLTAFNFQVIYTDKNNIAPQNVKLHVVNTVTGFSFPEVSMTKISQGGDVLSDGNFANGEIYTANNILYDTGIYKYYFTANDGSGNLVEMPYNERLNFGVVPSTYTYIPQYSFGTENGDGNNWQVWSFNGSNVYDWSDTYVDNYLHEQFKLQDYPGGFWCSQCLQRGIFNHDPQKGFETYDLLTSNLEHNPQNNMIAVTYDVSLQWDATGYTYTISHDATVDATGHTDVANVNENMWVGWDGSFNNFKTFPSGRWQGASGWYPFGYTGGDSMILKPYPVYVYSGPILSKQKSVTSFNFMNLVPEVDGVLDENNHTISMTVSFGTDVKTLVPTIGISLSASVVPNNNVVQDFTNPVTYTVTAENGSIQNYIVTVNVAPDPNPVPAPVPDPVPAPDVTPPSITSYTLNGVADNVTINPAKTPVSVVLNSSENVNWMSIKIENQNDIGIYKTFLSGNGCVDGTNTCSKTWDGALTKGDIQNGAYHIKVHMKDPANNEFNDYILPYVINVDTSI